MSEYSDVLVVIPFSGDEGRSKGLDMVEENYRCELPGCLVWIVGPADNQLRAVNGAIRKHRDYPVVICGNADCIVSGEALREAVRRVREKSSDLVYPYNGLFYDVEKPGAPIMRTVHTSSVAGVQVFSRESFWYYGAWNENFNGPGPDDLELYRRFLRLGAVISRTHGVLEHIYHGPRRHEDDPRWVKNHEYLALLDSMNEEEFKQEMRGWAWLTTPDASTAVAQKKRIKIAVYAIAKNEEANVPAWLESAREADEVLVLDTGSIDNTVPLLCDGGARVIPGSVAPWRFDVAFNTALALLPDDVDVCVRLDLDETLIEGWGDMLRQDWQQGFTAIWHPYAWSLNNDGTPNTLMQRKYIHARHGYTWRGPAHEALVWEDAKAPESVGSAPALMCFHHHTPGKVRAPILDTLRLACAEYPGDDRWVYYLGREYYYAGMNAEAIETLNKYLAMNKPFPQQRCDAYRWLARVQPEQAEAHLLRALAEDSSRRDPWGDLAEHYYKTGFHLSGWSAAMRALAITDRGWYITDGKYWGAMIHDIASLCAYYAGLKDVAKEQVLLALHHAPQDARIRNNATEWMGVNPCELP